MSAGPLLAGAGLAMLTLATSGRSYLRDVLPPVVVFGLGLAITVAPLATTAMSSAPAEHSGLHCGLDAPPLATTVSQTTRSA
jgi:hypothetical protein